MLICINLFICIMLMQIANSTIKVIETMNLRESIAQREVHGVRWREEREGEIYIVELISNFKTINC